MCCAEGPPDSVAFILSCQEQEQRLGIDGIVQDNIGRWSLLLPIVFINDSKPYCQETFSKPCIIVPCALVSPVAAWIGAVFCVHIEPFW